MLTEVVLHKGDKNKPLVVFVHGMGLDIRIWNAPAQARVLGGKYPLSVLFKGCDIELQTTFLDLNERGFPVLAWSQSRPAGPIGVGVAELDRVIHAHADHAGEGIVLIGHSRGGLIARKYLEQENALIRGFITLATPHHGTSMARWVTYISPFAAALERILGKRHEEEARTALHRILAFLSSTSVREMLPGSSFFAELKEIKQKGIRYVSLGGTSPDLVRFGGSSIIELVTKFIPERFVPEELKKGYGDGMVSASSAKHPYANDHRNFPANHASILFDREARGYIVKIMEQMI
ncbi:MAG: alpha/beta fold hydrolase [Nitrospirota bacterium]